MQSLHFTRGSRFADIFVPLQLILWIIFMATYVVNVGHFLYDEAYFYDRAVTAITGKQIIVFGPFISGSSPTAYTPGGILFYLMGLPFLFTTNPLAGMYWIIFSSCIGAFLVDRTLRKFGYSPIFRIAFALLETWGFWHAFLADRLWNVDLFWITISIFLCLILRVIHQEKHSRWLAFGIGIASATILQIHLGALVPIAIAGILILLYRKQFITKQNFWYAFSGGVLLYLPYLVHDFMHDFFNLKHMAVKVSANSETYRKAFLTLFDFTTPSWERTDLQPWHRFVQIAVTASTSLLIVVGLFRKGISRVIGLSCLTLLPLFFLLARRNFEHHYVTSVIPLLFLVPAAGVEWLWDRKKIGRLASVIFLIAFIGINSFLTYLHYNRGVPHRHSTSALVIDAKQWNDGGTIIIKENDSENFLRYSIAKNYLGGVNKIFKNEQGQECKIVFGHSDKPGNLSIGPGTHYACE